MSSTSYCGKRALDLLLTCLAIVLLAPVVIAVALLVRLALGSPVLFRQRRPGLNGEQFTCVKFRTMKETRDSTGHLLSDEERMTRIGHFLRSASLDELPELWNVLRGQMSVVGPRPLLPEYLPRYTAFQRRRHQVKPGITGWAQVNGRNTLSWEKKFEFDVWYVDHQSFWLDMKILWLTLGAVLRRDGINQPGKATVDYFSGDSSEVTR